MGAVGGGARAKFVLTFAANDSTVWEVGFLPAVSGGEGEFDFVGGLFSEVAWHGCHCDLRGTVGTMRTMASVVHFLQLNPLNILLIPTLHIGNFLKQGLQITCSQPMSDCQP